MGWTSGFLEIIETSTGNAHGMRYSNVMDGPTKPKA